MIEWMRQGAVVAIVECRLHVTSAAWRVAVLVSVLLAGVATTAGVLALDRQQNEIDILTALRTEVGDGGRHIVSGFQRDEALRMIRPASPTSVLVQAREAAQYRDPGPDGLALGAVAPHQAPATETLDVEFILRGIIGLIATIIGAGSPAAARNRGATKSLVALPIRPTALVAGALTGGLAAITVAVAVIVAASVAASAVSAPSLISTSFLGAAAMLWVSAAVFGAALQGLGAIAALWARTTAGALSSAVATWLITTIVAIPLVGAGASGLAPVEPRALFETKRLGVHRDTIADIEFAAGEIVVRDLGLANIRPDIRLEGRLLAEVEDLWDSEMLRLRATMDGIETGLSDDETAHAKWLHWLSLPFPGVLFRSAASDLAGVGAKSSDRWSRETLTYQDSLNVAVFDRRPRINFRVRRQAGSYSIFLHDRAPRPTVSELPPFLPQRPSLRTQVRDAAPSVMLLALHGAITWLIAMLTFLRRQTRHGAWH